ncbi:MAG: hypothetical protein JWM95_5652 [Gemmatimonadetes bacterium]|nr:hypothetical protein [Gemmatimonadota bacterium]
MTGPTAPGGSAGDELPSTDQTALDRLRRFGGGKLLGEMINLFITTAPERIDAARKGLAAEDIPATEMALHSLKSSSAQLGAMRMQRLSERGENLARGGTLAGVLELIRELDDEFPRVQSWLERARNTETP